MDTLNISNNRISKLSNLSCCPNLRTLICTNNKLDSVDSIEHLAELTGLQTLDLQNNDISDPGDAPPALWATKSSSSSVAQALLASLAPECSGNVFLDWQL